MKSLTLRSNAKINIGLRITGEREDGYHLIETIFQEIDFGDTITFIPRAVGGVVLQSNQPEVPTDNANLCVQAYQLLVQHYGLPGGMRIHLDKQIPVGAGLGGGSSNAATTLLGLCRMYNLHLGPVELTKMALLLGADVPFFLYGGTALASGIGEELTPLETPLQQPVVLVLPEINISTEWAYKNVKYDLTNKPSENKFKGYFDNWKDNPSLTNEFEALVIERYSEIGEIKDRLFHLQADYASISGSGSAVFGIFPDEATANRATQELRSHYRVELIWPVRRKINRIQSILYR